MPTNLLKKYPELLDLALYKNEKERDSSLLAIYNRDIVENNMLAFQSKRIYPTKDEDGEVEMSREFMHLTREEITDTQPDGTTIDKRVFDMFRSQRLHWIKPHIMEQTGENDIVIFSVNQADPKTIIYNRKQKYVIILQPQKRSGNAYYLLTAYYLNKDYGVKMIERQLKKRLDEVL